MNKKKRKEISAVDKYLVLEALTCPSTEERLSPFSYLCVRVSQGNKGAVSVRLSFYGHMLCFLNCHLAAHMQYAKERMDEFEYIMDSQKFESPTAPRIIDHR